MCARTYIACIAIALAAPMLLAVSGAVDAQGYPNRPVRIIVPFPPGGGADNLGRIIGHKLSELWKQQVIIDNRAGAGGNIGTEAAARAPADGYTLAVTSAGIMAINPFLYARVPYDPVKDFIPISMGVFFSHIVVAHPSIPVQKMTDLIALAKAKPGQVTFSSAGVGTPNHLAGELLNTMTGIKLLHVPYKGTGPQVIALLGGEVALSFSPLPAALPHIKSSRLRALAVTTLKRLVQVPEVPTVDESGVKGYEVIGWNGFLFPAGVPADIVAKVNADIVRSLGAADVKERFAADGSDPWATTPEEFAHFIRAEIAKWSKVVRASGARAN